MKTRILVASPSFSSSKSLMQQLKLLGEVVFSNEKGTRFDEVGLEELLKSVPAEVAVIGLEPLSRRVIEAAPAELKFVAKYGVGLNNIDQDALKDRGIRLGWTGGVNKRSVSELALGFALGHLRNVSPSISLMRQGVWRKSGGVQLSDCVFGIVGFGNVGQDLAHLLKGFGVRVLYCDIVDRSIEAGRLNAQAVSYEALLAQSDVVSFHVPSTVLTFQMLNAERLSLLKSTALVINTSRGTVVDFERTCQAVVDGRIGGFASDVFPEEPSDVSSWRDCLGLYFTPHIGGNSREAIAAMGGSVIAHIQAYLGGKAP